MKAKKHLGQHFLTDKGVVHDILRAIRSYCDPALPLLEIGPGTGALTFSLVEEYPEFAALELDRDMIRHLGKTLPPGKLHHVDFLKAPLDQFFPGKPFNLVGNFPYNISSQIIFRMIEHAERIPYMVGMFQKELAERVCAEPGSKANGVISILAQAWYETELLFTISAGSFSPPPKVKSAVIMLRRKSITGPDCDFRLLRSVVRQAFQQRRKKMRNTLKSFGIDMEDPLYQKRPEELGVADFVNIVQKIKNE